MEESFAFIIHSRYTSDAARKFSIMKFLPSFIVNLACRYSPPLIASKITGLKSWDTKKPIEGWLLICPLTTRQLLNNRELGKKRIKETIFLAEKLGAKIVGIGAILPSITMGGIDLINDIKIGITHGRALTVGISMIGIKEIAKARSLNLNEVTVAVVGATGIIGKAISKLLINEGVDKFILIGKNLERLILLQKEMKEINPSLSIETSCSIHFIKNAELVIVASSSPEILINTDDLKYRAIVYDVTQPQNTSPELVKKRKDVLIIDGGIVSTPRINYHFDFGLPPETAFACMAETLILAAEGRYNSRLVEDVNLSQVKELLKMAEKYNFAHAPFQSFGKPISI